MFLGILLSRTGYAASITPLERAGASTRVKKLLAWGKQLRLIRRNLVFQQVLWLAIGKKDGDVLGCAKEPVRF